MDGGSRPEPRKYGIAISGGGHRATAWALGALLYFVDCGANRHVGSIASVSGGSLANAFIATRDKPFDQMTPTEFEGHAAALGRTIAGRPNVFHWVLAVYATALVGGLVILAVDGLDAWWRTALVWAAGIAVAALFGPGADGTVWSSPLWWAYAGVLVPGLVATFALWWLDLGWEVRAALVAGAAVAWALLFSLRGVVVGKAFERSVCDSRDLAAIADGVQHVFCATEMHAGEHAYFSSGFVYSEGFGIGVPGDLPLHTAVQASANLPGAFPLRVLRARRFDFVLGRHRERTRHLVLTDGGVFDNMADAWFLDLEKRTSTLAAKLTATRRASKPDQPELMRGHELELRRRLDSLRTAFPWVKPAPGEDDEANPSLVVLNGAPSVRWARLNRVWLPGVGELFGFTKVTKVQYNNSTLTRSRDLIQRFKMRRPRGVLVTIEEDPSWLPVQYMEAFDRDVRAWAAGGGGTDEDEAAVGAVARQLADASHESTVGFGPVAPDLSRVCELVYGAEKAERKLERLERVVNTLRLLETHVLPVPSPPPAGDVRSLSLANRAVRTHLNPLGKEATARLMFHAYVQAMVTLHVIFAGPFTLGSGKAVTLERFRALLGGSGPGTSTAAEGSSVAEEAGQPGVPAGVGGR